MKFRELVDEDASAGATVAADIAHVSYPLFVKGKTPQQRRRNARLAVGQRADSASNYIGKGVYEAHTLDNDSVIYKLDPADPMNGTEVLVLGGAGRYSLKRLREKARREANELAASLKGEHGSSFRDAAHNIKQLTNTLNTIVAAYNELKRIRSRGGRGSRGITDEDTTFIREFMTTVLTWVGKSNLTEDEKDEITRHGQLITWPKGTAMVDVSDVYDWYKLGMTISDLDDFSPEDFHHGPPHTTIVFGSEEEEAKFVPILKNLKFNVHDIDEPSDIARVKYQSKLKTADADKMESNNLHEEKKLNKDYINAISGMYHLGMSPGYDFYRFSVHIAGNQGGYDAGLGIEGGPFAYAFTDAEEKMIQDAVKAVGGKIKKLTPRGSKESDDVNKTSPVANTEWKKDLYK